MRSEEVYKTIRTVISPWCKSHGFKRTKRGVGWFRKQENGFLTFTVQTLGIPWMPYVSGQFQVYFRMSETDVGSASIAHNDSLTQPLHGFFTNADRQLARQMLTTVASKVKEPPENLTNDAEFLIVSSRRARQPVLSGTEVTKYRYMDAQDVENWALFIRDRLPGITDAISQDWSEQRPDASPVVAGTPQTYEPWEDILKAPENDQARLVYADWLEERGDPRAEFIRVQCELASQPLGVDTKELRKRQSRLLGLHREQWCAEFDKLPVSKLCFHRGFVDEITITANQFVKAGDRVLDAMPLVRKVNVKSGAGKLGELAETAALSRIESFGLHQRLLVREQWPELINSPNWKRLNELDFSHTDFLGEAIHVLMRSETLAQVTRLNLRNSQLHENGLEGLIASPHVRELKHLNLDSNRISSHDAVLIANCESFKNLESLVLNHNSLGGRGILHLLQSPFLNNLKVLRISSVRATVAAIEALADPTKLPALELVQIWDAAIDEEHLAPIRKRCIVDDASYYREA